MIYAITNRKLVSGDEEVFFKQIEKIAAAKPDGIILREKDMVPAGLTDGTHAERCQEICDAWGTPLILNHFWEIGEKLDIHRIHLSMPVFRQMIGEIDGMIDTNQGVKNEEVHRAWEMVGVSVHSREEAVYAEKAGADYLIAGHIFLTDCKKGVPDQRAGFFERNMRGRQDSCICHWRYES